MRTRTLAETLANGGRSRGQTAVRGEDAADGWGRPVSVPLREGLTSGTRSSVTAQRGGGSARSPRGPRALGPEWAVPKRAAAQQCCFSFSFLIKNT